MNTKKMKNSLFEVLKRNTGQIKIHNLVCLPTPIMQTYAHGQYRREF